MLIEMVIAILLLIVLIMQFFVNKITRYIAIFIVVLLVVFQLYNIGQNYKDKKKTEEKLNNIQSSLEYSIDWHNMDAKLEFIESNIDIESIKYLYIPIKFYSLENIKLPKNGNINIEKIIEDSYENRVFKYKGLKSKYLEDLFNVFSDEQGSIYQYIEEEANIGHLYLKPKNIEDNYINFSVEYSGLESLGKYNTLQKLNNTILITQIPILNNRNIKELQLNINTAKGVNRLNFGHMQTEDGRLRTKEYMGIYIPNNFYK